MAEEYKEYKVFDILNSNNNAEVIMNIEDVIAYYEGILSEYGDKYEELTLCHGTIRGLRSVTFEEHLLQTNKTKGSKLTTEHSILNINKVGDEV